MSTSTLKVAQHMFLIRGKHWPGFSSVFLDSRATLCQTCLIFFLLLGTFLSVFFGFLSLQVHFEEIPELPLLAGMLLPFFFSSPGLKVRSVGVFLRFLCVEVCLGQVFLSFLGSQVKSGMVLAKIAVKGSLAKFFFDCFPSLKIRLSRVFLGFLGLH